ncbi:hypothetical protein CPB83DRAFT_456490 [Crepidotus variabilis]|uniref:Uncharacterized protein n=1 Tax=Crepidotus variabilis TaxID=179855 RepID=A0A9P6JN62_9AGAR|nr:hypothetical protein CPB83DRAFT_456490 [Crepidotus variabilis]
MELFMFFDRSSFEDATGYEIHYLDRFLPHISFMMPLITRLGIGSNDLTGLWGHLASNRVIWNLPNLEYLHILDKTAWLSDYHDPFPGLSLFDKSPLTHLSANGPFLSRYDLDNPLVDWSKITYICLTETLNTRTRHI